jgi:hypothetical protein
MILALRLQALARRVAAVAHCRLRRACISRLQAWARHLRLQGFAFGILLYGGMVSRASRDIQRVTRGFLARRRVRRLRTRAVRTLAQLHGLGKGHTTTLQFVRKGGRGVHSPSARHGHAAGYCVERACTRVP